MRKRQPRQIGDRTPLLNGWQYQAARYILARLSRDASPVAISALVSGLGLPAFTILSIEVSRSTS
jgi:hypothetical protein